MRFCRSIPTSAAVLLGATLIAQAAPQYPWYPFYPVPVPPAAWSYDPYTSGLSPCPQWMPGDSSCRNQMPPTYGQPDYRPAR
jgi:hypothetical protein